jgi:hypothetical protein
LIPNSSAIGESSPGSMSRKARSVHPASDRPVDPALLVRHDGRLSTPTV